MGKNTFRQPDGNVMLRLLREYAYEPTGIILRLAWREGLTRMEINDLTWDQVDFEGKLLRLPDREVPLEDEVAETLRRWKLYCEKFSIYVAVTDRLRKRLVPQSISNMARSALDAGGQYGVRLQDLRYDFVRRQFLEHDWPYVLRVSGISVTTYRNSLSWLAEGQSAGGQEPRDRQEEEYRLWRILQTEQETPAGIALWLSSQLGLQCEEMIRLTWDGVDFDGDLLRLPGREVPLTQDVRWVLGREKARRGPGDDPHVLLTPKSRKPMDGSRLATLVRTTLIRGGIEDRTLSDFRRDTGRDAERQVLLRYADEHGSVSRREAAALLGISDGMAYRRLLALTEDGALIRISLKYYPADRAVPPERQTEAVRDYILEMGSAKREDIAGLLHIGQRQTGRLLRRMVDAGELVLLRRSRRYTLPLAQDSPAFPEGTALSAEKLQ